VAGFSVVAGSLVDPQPDNSAPTNAMTNIPLPNRLRMTDRRYRLGI
jgi:hypothetical protein